MDKPKILVILGSIREGRLGDKVAKWFMETTKNNPNAELELVDLLNHTLPLFADSNETRNLEIHPNAKVREWKELIASGDGYIFITPEHNHSFSSVLKNAIDYCYKQWNEKPVGFVGYGSFAGASRAVEQLRQIVAELRMYDVRDQVLIPAVWQAFDEQGQLKNPEMHNKNAELVVNKVAELAKKLKLTLI
jgi:NAD(P)H-dependent FMN reductase